MRQDDLSLADQVTEAVRRSIIEGRLPAGTRLTEVRLAADHETSRVPVREALRRLEIEGFVTVAKNRGATVSRLTANEARSLLDVRGVLETLVAQSAAERRTDEDIQRLRQVLEAGRAALAKGRTEELIELNTRFHRLLVEASGNMVAGDLLGQLRRKIEWLYSRRLGDRAEDSWREHEAILEAVADGDSAGAGLLIGAHIHNAQRALQLTGAVTDPDRDVGDLDGHPAP